MSPRTTRTSTALLIIVGTATGALLTQAPVAAHTGHDISGIAPGLIHPITGPDHLVAMFAVGMVAALAGTRRTALLMPFGFVTGMILGAMLALGSINLPGIELLIAISAITLGALCIARVRRDTLLLPLAALAFGVAHGQAHGAEIPLTASPLAYGIGFVAATTALHLAGGAMGLALRHSARTRAFAGAVTSGVGLALLLGV
jgi:urease accessory protein